MPLLCIPHGWRTNKQTVKCIKFRREILQGQNVPSFQRYLDFFYSDFLTERFFNCPWLETQWAQSFLLCFVNRSVKISWKVWNDCTAGNLAPLNEPVLSIFWLEAWLLYPHIPLFIVGGDLHLSVWHLVYPYTRRGLRGEGREQVMNSVW